MLDALAESIEDWTALTAAEFHESAPFDAAQHPTRLSAAIATLQIAAQQTPTQASVVSVPAALADWLREHGTS
ncbi:MAG: hypothetical protein KUG57_04290 [Ilumatobacteraceae bacterium]|nr:hypothetical protein [Ilumatobacteraceae bacterium]